MKAVAAHRLTSLPALSKVEGFGPKRLERYGAAIVELVRNHH
jgi:hypothetical protein